ncbi:ABC transporter permease [Candidatus Chloroploca sp. Khr17]|uniref:ABC transporter permease n=1 Tax=Candidatus Chloroploca sp. Khr17 TaxID=2496869 RepID=UPI00101DE5E5|nr:ABC transporter permease [Candidatus Chloroploca sp. Khr17]
MAELSDKPVVASRETIVTPGWQRWLIRVRAYFWKEVNEIRRQPLLILSLIIGPLLVLILFGSTYVNSNPRVRTAVVLPAEGIPGLEEEQLRQVIGLNFDLRLVTRNQAEAEALLATGAIDLIQVLPDNIFQTMRSGVSPEIFFTANVINPLVEGWVQYLAYAQVNEINRTLLVVTTARAQEEAAGIRVRVVDFEGKILEFEQGISEARKEAAEQDLKTFIDFLDELNRILPPQEVLAQHSDELAQLRPILTRVRINLREVRRALLDETLSEGLLELTKTRSDLQLLSGTLEIFVNIAPDRLVSPVKLSYRNLRGSAYSAVVYYSPGVLALLVQHTAITLGALALVRERLMGAFEVFRVAPVSLHQLIIGKYLGYIVFIGLATLALIIAMLVIGVPLLGNWLQFAGLTLLLIIASLGVGFLISALSGSDSQAIQLAMISLLLSIFFSGFFISVESFAPVALPVVYAIPMSHGLAGFQYLMLRGLPPSPGSWLGLSLISIITFALVVIITRRQLQRA